MTMLGEEKYFMACMLFDLNIRGKVCFLFHRHLTERLVNFVLVSFYSLQINGSHLLTELSASALPSVPLALCNPARLMYLKQKQR